jgi:hypothetical protein
LGIYYFNLPGIADVTEFDVSYSRLALTWGEVEPQDGLFNWNCSQAQAIGRILENGIAPVPVIRTAGARWATGGDGSTSSFPPLDLEDRFHPDYGFSRSYYEFVRAMAEHWRGKLPVVVLENEVTAENFWKGTMEEYTRLLRTAKKAFQDAGEEVKVADSGLASPIWGMLLVREMLDEGYRQEAVDYFDDYTGQHPGFEPMASAEELFAYFQDPRIRAILDEADYLLNEVPHFADVFNFHFYEKPSYLADVVSFIKNRTGGMPLLANELGIRYRKETPDLDRRASEDLVKKFVVSLAAGLELALFFPFENPDHNVIGLLEEPGLERRPLYYACQWTVSKLKDCPGALRLALGEGVSGFKLVNPKRPLWVLWAEEGEREVALDVEANFATLIRVVMDRGETQPRAELLRSQGGVLRLRVTQTPVFVEVAKSGIIRRAEFPA